MEQNHYEELRNIREVASDEYSWAKAVVYGIIRDADWAGISLVDLKTKYALKLDGSDIDIKTEDLRKDTVLDKILLDLLSNNAVTLNIDSKYSVRLDLSINPIDQRAFREEYKISERVSEKTFAILSGDPGKYTNETLVTKILVDLNSEGFQVSEYKLIQILGRLPFICPVSGPPNPSAKLKLCYRQ